MKKSICILSMIALGLTAITSCNNNLDFENGGAIRFGVSTGYHTGSDTKTTYTGEDENGNVITSTSAYERIDWLDTDKIRIASPQAYTAGSNNKFADYKVVPSGSDASTASIAPATGNGLTWGEGAHTFFAVYPSPGQNSNVGLTLNNDGTEAAITASIPAVQTVELHSRTFKPNMDYAYMYAVKSGVSVGSAVTLEFKPLVTTLEFSLLTDEDDPVESKLTAVKISTSATGDSKYIAGTIKPNTLKVSSDGELSTLTASGITNGSQTIIINLPDEGVELSTDPTEAYTITFLCLPVDLEQIQIFLYFADGTYRRLYLADAEDSGLNFPARTKTYIRKLGPTNDCSFTPLSFEAATDGVTVTMNMENIPPRLQFRINDADWAQVDRLSFSLNEGDVLQFKGTVNSQGVVATSQTEGHGFFTLSGLCYVYGNIMSLRGDNFPELTTPSNDAFKACFAYNPDLRLHPRFPLRFPETASARCYSYMFAGCTGLTAPPDFQAKTLANYCYQGMFSGCTGLRECPELKATELKKSCYHHMFSGCTNLETAPILPATSLAESCYEGMFRNCTSLTKAPELPATELATKCYANMFEGCTGFVTDYVVLPATELAELCYSKMFINCTSLTEIPDLSAATSLEYACCGHMFQGCTGLETLPMLPATELADECYFGMFKDCTGLTDASAACNPNATLAMYCYSYMFEGCTSLTDAPELPHTVLSEGCYDSMFMNCTSLEEAPELPATTVSADCYFGMFQNCTSLTDAPELPATDLSMHGEPQDTDWATGSDYCYSSMFKGCTSLVTAPDLPATVLALSCYEYMFDGCTSLTEAPHLPAMVLEEGCYYYMFNGCSSLETAPELPAMTLAKRCYNNMFLDCISLTEAPDLPASIIPRYGYQNMFQGCTSLTTPPEIEATVCEEEIAQPGNRHFGHNCVSMFEGCTSLATVPDLDVETVSAYCFDSMFKGCTSLTSVPNDLLPATTLSNNCYADMFSGCTSLTSVPNNLLPATTLANSCYRTMFDGCSSLVTAPALPATTLAHYCYYEMFRGCSRLTTAPDLLARQLVKGCYHEMFRGCSRLNYVKCLIEEIPAYEAVWKYDGPDPTQIEGNTILNPNGQFDIHEWLRGVSSTGTFVILTGADWSQTYDNEEGKDYRQYGTGIPTNWTIIEVDE